MNKEYSVEFKSGETYLFQIREDRFKLMATQDNWGEVTVHPNHQGLKMSGYEACHRMGSGERLSVKELIDHPASDFSIDLDTNFHHLCFGGSNWYSGLATRPRGRGEWVFGIRWHVICSIARPNDRVSCISREEAAMILFQCKGSV